jgi:signal transduction histidine kinase
MPSGDGERQLRVERANRAVAIRQLSASIAHEISQPLSGIITNAGTCLRLLAGDPPNVAGAAETARLMIRDANRASGIIRRLRALFSTGRMHSEVVDLNEASREAISLSLRELQSGRVLLQLEFADDLPFVEGDRLQLQEVLLNLIRNASDAMRSVEDRSRQLTMRTAKTEADSVLVTVQDTGPGLDPANLEHLFEAFFTTKPGGLGMGLAVCRTIIEAHGGKLWATVAVPQGAIFQFRLPAKADAPSRSTARSTNRRES